MLSYTKLCQQEFLSLLWRLRQLRKIEAKIRFVSFEPLLEDLGEFSLEGIQWSIVGGESDYQNPRPMKSEWAERIRKICERDSVAFFLKANLSFGEHLDMQFV